MRKLSLSDWASVAEIAGTVAVVISLLIVASSLDRNTTAVSGQGANDLYDGIRQIEIALLTNSELAMITIRGREDPDGLSETEAELYETYVGMYIDLWDRAHEREQEGLIQSQALGYWHAYFHEFIKRNLTKDMWEKMKWGWPDPIFQQRVDAALAD